MQVSEVAPIQGVLFFAAAALGGCSTQSGQSTESGLSGSLATLSAGTGGLQGSTGQESSSGGVGPGACESVVADAQVGPPPQDIIIVVDNSSSMVDEAGFAQDELNAFSSQIDDAAVDAHIVLISALPTSPAGICVAPPLGSGGCPQTDTNPPVFVHIDTIVGSSDALTRVGNLYPDYAEFLRPTASTHLLVISDDDTNVGPMTFLDEIAAVHPRFSDLRVHAIVAAEDRDAACDAGTACCEYASLRGSRYTEIAALTGGVVGDLCEQEFSPIFDALAQDVISEAKLPCAFEIPAPPEGADFDRDEVNVALEDGQGQPTNFGRADGSEACAQVGDGWFYDDPDDPTEIRLCPQTCESVQGLGDASISVILGCATIPAA